MLGRNHLDDLTSTRDQIPKQPRDIIWHVERPSLVLLRCAILIRQSELARRPNARSVLFDAAWWPLTYQRFPARRLKMSTDRRGPWVSGGTGRKRDICDPGGTRKITGDYSGERPLPRLSVPFPPQRADKPPNSAPRCSVALPFWRMFESAAQAKSVGVTIGR